MRHSHANMAISHALDSTSASTMNHQSNHTRSTSHNRSRNTSSPPPRPTTPLRPPSRSSLRSSHTPTHPPSGYTNPLSTLEPSLGELADGMADLEANFVHLQLMHESLSRFNESFASFLYGLNVNAFCVDFPEAPVAESWRRAKEDPAAFAQAAQGAGMGTGVGSGYGGRQARDMDGTVAGDAAASDADQTFLTTDTTFIENPPASSRKSVPSSDTSRFSAPGRKAPVTGSGGQAGSSRGGARGGASTGTAKGIPVRGRPSGLARPSGRGRGGVGR